MCVHRIPFPTSVTIASRPSMGNETSERKPLIWGRDQSRQTATDWHDGQITLMRHALLRDSIARPSGPALRALAPRRRKKLDGVQRRIAPCPPSLRELSSEMVSTRSLSPGAHSRDPLALHPTILITDRSWHRSGMTRCAIIRTLTGAAGVRLVLQRAVRQSVGPNL
jgi:hypothetical protein